MSAPSAALPQPPLRNCYWVVPGLLLAGEHPGGTTRDKTKDRLKKLLGAGIECFVDLTKPTELLRYDVHLPFYVEYVRKPIKDHGLPASNAAMVEILEHIGNAMRAGRPVYLHCRAGIGRTGTVVGCLLVERGLSGDGALDELNRLWQQCKRSKTWSFIPETDEQAQYVRGWSAQLPRAVFDMTPTAAAIASLGSVSAAGERLTDEASVAAIQARAARQATGAGQAREAVERVAGGQGQGRDGGAVAAGGARPGGDAAGGHAQRAVDAFVQDRERSGVDEFAGVRHLLAGDGAAAERAPAERAPAGGGRDAGGSRPGGEVVAPRGPALGAGDGRGAAFDGGGSRADGGARTEGGPRGDSGGARTEGGPRADSGGARTDGGPRADSGGARTDGGARADSGGARTDGGARADSGGARTDGGARADSGGARSEGGPRADGSARADGGARADSGGAGSEGAPRADGGARIEAPRVGVQQRVAASVEPDPLMDPATLAAARGLRDRFIGALYGLAVGDAVAAATQYRRPGSFTPVGDMLGGGPFDLPRGGWSDDTAMALCLAESLLECNGFDARDQVQRYGRWQQEGYMTSTGQCVGITASTARALAMARWRRQVFPGSHDPEQLDPEPLSRISPIALYFFASLDAVVQQAADSARTTCQAPVVLDCCRRLARAIHVGLAGQPKSEMLAEIGPGGGDSAAHSSGTAVAVLASASWAFSTTDNYRDAILRAANVGGNSDVVASVTGQLAGAHYGVSAIPASWRTGLMQKELIEGFADRLLAHGLVSLGG